MIAPATGEALVTYVWHYLLADGFIRPLARRRGIAVLLALACVVAAVFPRTRRSRRRP